MIEQSGGAGFVFDWGASARKLTSAIISNYCALIRSMWRIRGSGFRRCIWMGRRCGRCRWLCELETLRKYKWLFILLRKLGQLCKIKNPYFCAKIEGYEPDCKYPEQCPGRNSETACRQPVGGGTGRSEKNLAGVQTPKGRTTRR